MILGGNEISIQVAKMLEEEINITIVEKMKPFANDW